MAARQAPPFFGPYLKPISSSLQSLPGPSRALPGPLQNIVMQNRFCQKIFSNIKKNFLILYTSMYQYIIL